MTTADDQAPAPRFGMLRIIALYKLLKVLLLLLAAYGELRLHDAALSAKLATWAQGRPLGLEHAVVIGNAAIVAYLVWHVRAKGRSAAGAAAAPPGAAQPTSPEERGRR